MFAYCELKNELKLKAVLQRCPEWYAQLSEIPTTMIVKGKEKGCVYNVCEKNNFGSVVKSSFKKLNQYHRDF